MTELAHVLVYLLSTLGLTILIVWPEQGPSAWLRDKVARPLLPGKTKELLDCYICCGFWCGLALSVAWWFLYREIWAWFGCLMVSGAFWLVLGMPDANHKQAVEERRDQPP